MTLRQTCYLMVFALLWSCSNENSSDNKLLAKDTLVKESTPVEHAKADSTSIPKFELLKCLKAYVGVEKGIYAAVYGDPMISGFRSALKNPNLGELIGNRIQKVGESDKVSNVYFERLQELDGLLSNPIGLKNAFMHDTAILYSCDEIFSQ
ncbi:MAG: hypothetical protein COA46_02805 [Porticoccaceae bacterium]|nr:MAG: hypothetical protein COA46_02805 [Porticoccaceae bacterium]